MRVTLISGSASKNSGTLALLMYIQKLLVTRSFEVNIWDLREHPLPLLLPEFHGNPTKAPDPAVHSFVKLVAQSDGIVLGTPLYQGSYSGLLKSALDWLMKDALRNKIVGLVGNSGRSTIALEALCPVIRTLYGYTLQTQIATERNDFEIVNNKLVLSNEEMKERSNRFIEELIYLTTVLKRKDSN